MSFNATRENKILAKISESTEALSSPSIDRTLGTTQQNKGPTQNPHTEWKQQ